MTIPTDPSEGRVLREGAGARVSGRTIGTLGGGAFVALVLSSALLASNAYAQTTGTSTAASPGTLEELIVTAKRRTEDLQHVGVAGSVLTEKDLIDKSVYGLTAVQYATPSVSISDYGSANVFNIRGIGRSQVDIDLPSGVVIYRDQAPTLAGYFQNEPYFDMHSIEVLRGPQGTFSGKSAAGGAVFINTNDPEMDELNGSVQVGVADHSELEFTGVGNMPLGETAALRLAVHTLDRNDYYDSIEGDYTGHPGERDLDSVRLGIRWQPIEEFEAILKTDYSDLDFGGNPTTSYGFSLFDVTNQIANFKYEDKSWRSVLNMSYELPNSWTVTSVSGWQDLETENNLDLNASMVPFYKFDSYGKVDIISQEFDLISDEDQRLRWVLGIFYQKQEINIPYWQKGGFTFTGGGFGEAYPWATSPWHNKEVDYAGFGHVQYDLTSTIELEAGVRWSYYDKNQYTEWVFGDGFSPNYIPWPFSDPPASPGGDSQSINDDSVDWTVGANWNVTQEQFVYGLVSRGHVVKGVNLFPPFLPYKEMEVINYELGWKGLFLDGQLRTQLDTYYQTYDDYQALFGTAGSPAEQTGTFRNASGDSDVWGVELTAQAAFGSLSIDFGAAYMDTELGTFENVLDPYNGNTPTDLSGAHSPFSPEWTANIGAAYDFQLPWDLVLTPRVDYSYIDETYASLWEVAQNKLKKRKLTNVQLRLAPADGQWWAQAWMTNATDEEFPGAIQNTSTLFYAAPPRRYGLRVGVNL